MRRIVRGLGIAVLLLSAGAAAAAAQVVRVVKVDAMTDKRQVYLASPTADGRATFGVFCDVYGLRATELLAMFEPASAGLVRFDRAPPLKLEARALPAPPSAIARDVSLLPADRTAFAAGLANAGKMALRLERTPPLDYAFDWTVDNRFAFMTAAELAGADRASASFGYDFLKETVGQVAAGRDPNQVAELLRRLKVDWRENGRPRETATFVGGILAGLAGTANPRTVADAGRVLFGQAWPKLGVLAQAGEKSYRALNRPMAEQLVWLRANCPN